MIGHLDATDFPIAALWSLLPFAGCGFDLNFNWLCGEHGGQVLQTDSSTAL
jgi:hypothetical protein